ncbi:MAG: hypothetical protein HQK89_04370 [Nitrospirae bacterium]|nr:hypothetical protein [Nitrospirota bacterium]
MEVKANNEEITISGHIRTIEDYQKIKQVVNSVVETGHKSVTIMIPESLAMTSSVIGFFLKLVFENKVDLKMYVKDERLYNLLEVLNLVTVFKVSRM